eukprot:9923131-Alexandrium_andersonii.AAC.1
MPLPSLRLLQAAPASAPLLFRSPSPPLLATRFGAVLRCPTAALRRYPRARLSPRALLLLA